MPITLTNSQLIVIAFKIGYTSLATLYFIFSLIVVRQVNLMSETVQTKTSGILKAFSLLHALLALAVIIFFLFFF